MDQSEFLKIAKQAALEAGKLIEKYSKLEHEIHDKGRAHDFATKADIEGEKIIVSLIKKHFPDHNIIAEESGEVSNNSEYTWAIDPIDGTIAFVNGMPVYGVSIGLLKNNQPILGVINICAIKDIYWAVEGKGAFLNGEKIKVREESNLLNVSVALSWGHTDRYRKAEKYFLPIIDKVMYPYALGSAVIAVGYVASGVLGGYIVRANIWDVAAGAIIVEEAGGKVTDFGGQPVDWTKKNGIEAVFSNSLVHDDLVKALNQKN